MSDEPRMVDVSTPAGALRVLTWGPEHGPIALCLHGFPDTAYGWRKIAPMLVGDGYRVVAPFMRGYAPSSIPADGSYHIAALMDDALRVRDALAPSDRDVLIGHDWGGVAAAGIAALPQRPFGKVVVMSIPVPSAFGSPRDLPDKLGLLAKLPAQTLRSWYIFYFQLPWLPYRSARWVLPLLWRRWSPGYAAQEDLRHVEAAIGSPDNWRSAIGTYRAVVRNSTPPAQYAAMHEHWLSPLQTPILHLHGDHDGAMAPFTEWVRAALPAGSCAQIIERAGHFVQLEQPQRVAQLILDFIGPAS